LFFLFCFEPEGEGEGVAGGEGFGVATDVESEEETEGTDKGVSKLIRSWEGKLEEEEEEEEEVEEEEGDKTSGGDDEEGNADKGTGEGDVDVGTDGDEDKAMGAEVTGLGHPSPWASLSGTEEPRILPGLYGQALSCQLLTKTMSLDVWTAPVDLSYSRYNFEFGAYPTKTISWDCAQILLHFVMGWTSMNALQPSSQRCKTSIERPYWIESGVEPVGRPLDGG
jgi:hypothetical protein